LSSGRSSATQSALAARRARIVAIGDDGRVFVSIGAGRRAVPAILGVAIADSALREAMDLRQEVVLVFENGDPGKPIIVGVIRGRETGGRKSANPRSQLPETAIEADVDGRRIRVQAQDELVFQCGKASITLRRNGRVIVRGAEIVSYAAGTNHIWGGQVKLN